MISIDFEDKIIWEEFYLKADSKDGVEKLGLLCFLEYFYHFLVGGKRALIDCLCTEHHF